MAVHEKILQWLEKGIFEGNISLGQDLPDDRQIATIIRASHSNTREGLKTLETMGIVRLYEGKRKTIIPHLVSAPMASTGNALRIHMAGARHPLRDTLQAQTLLETWAVAQPYVDKSALDELEQIIEAMLEMGVLPPEFHALEVDFHIALTKLAGNHMVTALMASLRAPLIESKISMMGRLPLWSSYASRIRAEQQAILGAVKADDQDLVVRLVLASIEEKYQEAGLDLDEETFLANALPGTQAPADLFEPIDVENEDLLPQDWATTQEPQVPLDLLAALENIQPAQAKSAEAGSAEIQPKHEDNRPEEHTADFADGEVADDSFVEDTKNLSVEEIDLTEDSADLIPDPAELSEQEADTADQAQEQEQKAGEVELTDTAENSQEKDAEQESVPLAASSLADESQLDAATSEPYQPRRMAVENKASVSSANLPLGRTVGAARPKSRRARGTVTSAVHATVIRPRTSNAQGAISGHLTASIPIIRQEKLNAPGQEEQPQVLATSDDVLRTDKHPESGKTLTGQPAPLHSAEGLELMAEEKTQKNRGLMGRLFARPAEKLELAGAEPVSEPETSAETAESSASEYPAPEKSQETLAIEQEEDLAEDSQLAAATASSVAISEPESEEELEVATENTSVDIQGVEEEGTGQELVTETVKVAEQEQVETLEPVRRGRLGRLGSFFKGRSQARPVAASQVVEISQTDELEEADTQEDTLDQEESLEAVESPEVTEIPETAENLAAEPTQGHLAEDQLIEAEASTDNTVETESTHLAHQGQTSSISKGKKRKKKRR